MFELFKRFILYTFILLLFYTLALTGIYFAFNDNLPDIDAWSFQLMT